MRAMEWLELYVAVLLTLWCTFDISTYFKGKKKKPRIRKSVAKVYSFPNKKRGNGNE